ncbi:MAG: hypothetical protein U5K75_02490 [Ahrensia sp.]|nr:hypothetical protein [Ahrensia sp.]
METQNQTQTATQEPTPAQTITWLDLLKAEAARSSITKVAQRLNYSRTAVSLALSGNYVGSTDTLARAVLDVFGDGGMIDCPHLQQPILKDDCDGYRTRALPQSNASALRHWRACQSCPRNVKNQKEARYA